MSPIYYGNICIPAKLYMYIFTHLKLCPATTNHNFKWVEITHLCLIWDQPFENRDV